MKKILTTLICCLITSSAIAGNRSAKQMREIAEKKIAAITGKTVATRSASDKNCIINKPTLAIYSNGNAFAIISRDDRYPAVLAYGAGTFDEDSLPANTKWWLEAVQRALESGRTITRSTTYQEVKPLLTTKWGQWSPFNNYAPSLKIYNGQKAPAGCVALAMAQCMNFQKYPASAEFTGYYYQEGVSDEVYQGNVKSTYTWPYADYYSNYYPEGSSESVKVSTSPRQGNLVATLCRDCAYAIEMQYTLSGSGAYTFDVPDALIDHFSYPAKAVRFYDRDYYTQQEWNDIVYGELAMGNPFIYAGSSSTGGHAFVADGCDSEGLIHFNWGWSGFCDGYFSMDLLNPSDSNFSEGQEIVTGIRPNTIDTDVYGSLVTSPQPFELVPDNEAKKITLKSYGIYNRGGKTIVGCVAIVFEHLTDPELSDYLYLMSDEDDSGETLPEEDYTLLPYYGWRAFDFDLDLDEPMPAGEYKVYLGSMDIRYEDEWQMGRTNGGTFYYEMSVDEDGNITIGDKPITTGVESVTVSKTSARETNGIYDLGGRRLGKTSKKGIFIRNGKKFMSK